MLCVLCELVVCDVGWCCVDGFGFCSVVVEYDDEGCVGRLGLVVVVFCWCVDCVSWDVFVLLVCG